MLEVEQQMYFHSVHLMEDKCKGCVNCIKRCPTEAIRVRDGKAHIIEARCIDCGECVRICPNQAKIVVADTLERLKQYKFNVALPAPAIYGQFREGTSPLRVLAALLAIGFDHVVDVAFAADLCGKKIREAIESPHEIRPLISSACPAVVRLIQVRFPNLIEHLLPVLSPMRAAANIAWHQMAEQSAFDPKDIGMWFISPCPGKVSAANEPIGVEDNVLTGAIPVAEVYPLIREKLNHSDHELEKMVADLKPGSGLGVGWARSGGENQSIGGSRQIAVDGIHNVIQILEEVERGKLSDIDYIEAQACMGGCVGGVLTVENSFITRRRVRILATDGADRLDNVLCDDIAQEALENENWFRHDKPIEPRPTLKLDDDMATAIRKMEQMERIVEDLPGLDCGSCGAPNCQALAEDVVRGLATEMDCVFKLRERVRQLAVEMMELAEKAPPAMGHVEKKAETKDAIGEHSPKSQSETLE
ncbi:MAG: [Fe-Fe] hydrogenase large subunit C-terminal domain-containing protein [Armatimonadota bacterium]|nr:4Fe-4S dicluster domain-containing protein [bacterium]